MANSIIRKEEEDDDQTVFAINTTIDMKELKSIYE